MESVDKEIDDVLSEDMYNVKNEFDCFDREDIAGFEEYREGMNQTTTLIDYFVSYELADSELLLNWFKHFRGDDSFLTDFENEISEEVKYDTIDYTKQSLQMKMMDQVPIFERQGDNDAKLPINYIREVIPYVSLSSVFIKIETLQKTAVFCEKRETG